MKKFLEGVREQPNPIHPVSSTALALPKAFTCPGMVSTPNRLHHSHPLAHSDSFSPHLCVGFFGCGLLSASGRRLPPLPPHNLLTHNYSHTTCPHTTYSHTTGSHTTYSHTTYSHTHTLERPYVVWSPVWSTKSVCLSCSESSKWGSDQVGGSFYL